MDKNRKKVLIFVFSLIIIISLLALILSYINKNEISENKENNIEENNNNNVIDNKVIEEININLEELLDLTLYNSVNTTMLNIYNNLYNNNLPLKIFSEEYRKINNINKENIVELFSNTEEDLSFRVKEAYYGNQDENYCVIFNGYTYSNDVDGSPVIINKNKYFVMHINMNNYKFNIENITENTFDNIKNAKKYTTYNVISGGDFKYQFLNEKSLNEMYFNNIKNNMFANPDYIYEILGENTKNTYFKNLQELKNYINNNMTKISESTLKNYTKVDNKYIITDNNDNIYEITYKSIFDFTFDIRLNNLYY